MNISRFTLPFSSVLHTLESLVSMRGMHVKYIAYLMLCSNDFYPFFVQWWKMMNSEHICNCAVYIHGNLTELNNGNIHIFTRYRLSETFQFLQYYCIYTQSSKTRLSEEWVRCTYLNEILLLYVSFDFLSIKFTYYQCL